MDVPFLASRFLVEIERRAVPVSEVRGLVYSPALDPAGSVTLRRAAGLDRTLLDWALEPKVRSLRVTLLGQRGGPSVSYLLEGARPTAWHGPELDATSPEVAHEELVLAVDRIDLG